MEHMAEHRMNRLKHILLLMKLNWFYRVRHGNTPYIYWDTPIVPEKATGIEDDYVKDKKELALDELLHYPESECIFRKPPAILAEELIKYDVISFDLFDTTILRNVKQPRDVFSILSVINNISDFEKVRSDAEEIARKKMYMNCASREVTLDEIYDEVVKLCGLDKKKGVEIELDTEYKICEINPYFHEVIDILTKYGKKIIFVSDTYFSTSFLTNLLIDKGLIVPFKVFTSNQFMCGKYNGGALFSMVSREFPQGTRFVHVGDNEKNDIENAKKVGWDSILYPSVAVAGKQYRLTNSFGLSEKIYAGILNNTLHNGLANHDLYEEYGFKYGGWIACGFCQYLNMLAEREKIDRFLFLSRDGFYLHKVYNHYYKKIENNYITISRYAASQLAFDRYITNYINFNILRRANEGTYCIGEVLDQLELVCLIPHLNDIGLEQSNRLTSDNFPIIKELILSYREEIWAEFENSREAAKIYYSQFIKPGEKICLVDVGWNGTTVIFMKHFLENICKFDVEICGAMIAGAESNFSRTMFDDGTLNSYLFSPYHNKDLISRHDFAIDNLFVEILFTEPKESFLHFIKDDSTGSISMLYQATHKANDEMVEKIGKGILKFADKYNEIVNSLNVSIDIPGQCAYEPLLRILKNKQYMHRLFDNYSNQVLPGKSDTAELASDYLRKKGY